MAFMFSALRKSKAPTKTASAFIEGGTIGSGSSVSMLPGLDSSLMSRMVDVGTIYKTNPWLFAVVDLIARSYSRMPPKMYRHDADGDQVRAEGGRGHQLENVLRAPGNGVSSVTLRKMTMHDRLLRNNALWRIHGGNLDEITGFERIPWKYVDVKNHDGVLSYRDTRHAAFDSAAHTWLAHEVIHFGLWEGDGPVGQSRVMALQSTLALFDAVYTHILSYFGRGARPSGHFHVDPEAGEQAVNQVASMIKEYFTGAANAGRVLITSGEWSSTSDSPDHSKIIELAKQSREEICGVFGVAPPLVGILDRAIMSNVRELREHQTRDTSGPHVESMDADFMAQIREHHPRYNGPWLETEQGATLKSDVEGMAKTAPNQLRFTTPNEIRQRLNLKPLDDPNASKLWFPNGVSDSSGIEGGESSSPESASFLPPRPEE